MFGWKKKKPKPRKLTQIKIITPDNFGKSWNHVSDRMMRVRKRKTITGVIMDDK